MKIQSSSIVMGSAHEENSYTYKESMTMEVAKSKNAVGAILTISKEAEGKSVKDAMVDYQTQQKEEAKKRQQESDQRALEKMAEHIRTNNKGNNYAVPQDENMEIKMLKKMLEILRGKKLTDKDMMSPSQNGGVLDLRSAQYKNMESIAEHRLQSALVHFRLVVQRLIQAARVKSAQVQQVPDWKQVQQELAQPGRELQPAVDSGQRLRVQPLPQPVS